MCGIVAVLRRRARRAPPSAAALRDLLGRVALPDPGAPSTVAPALAAAAEPLGALVAALAGPPGITTLLAEPAVATLLEQSAGAMAERIAAIEATLDDSADDGSLEAAQAALLQIKDRIWQLREDRLRHTRDVEALAGGERGTAAIEAFSSIALALAALDRLEVRGRDSAGLLVLVDRPGELSASPELAARLGDRLLTDGAIRRERDRLAFIYKRAAEIGELGDNVRALRARITGDMLLRQALRGAQAEALVLGHTRWASVGIISLANAHPLDSVELERTNRLAFAALNGDVDNHAELATAARLRVAPEITTDAKVIPTLLARRLDSGEECTAAFRALVSSFTGSIAIGAAVAGEPHRLFLAQRGSGQALYIGLAEDAFVVASEPYGFVAATDRYVRLDGETPADPRAPEQSRGQVVVLDGTRAGEPGGVDRIAYDGTPLRVGPADLRTATLTTRDVDRGDAPHYLLKEITEAPRSFQRTLRGRIVQSDGMLRVRLGESSLPQEVRAALRDGSVRRVLWIGQGTAAVAGRGVAALARPWLAAAGIAVEAVPATELSGFGLQEQMQDTLVVAISQSGTTTDTNRTVDLVRRRGARVLAIVNRRGSDLCDRADGVLFTSDGRDVEMSVASTKAFYAQIAAGALLGLALAEAALGRPPDGAHDLLAALRALPDQMRAVLATRGAIAQAAAAATARRSWALVGNGRNRVAAEEIRIKLSELCYRSIACDATEDKKHIDLSTEPLVLVCAAGLAHAQAEDVQKEVAIFRAHKALPVVITDLEPSRFPAAAAVLRVPQAPPALGFVLATVAGHLFGYEAARAIDALARPLREMRAAVEALAERGLSGAELLAALPSAIAAPVAQWQQDLGARRHDGQLEASTAVRLAALLRYATGAVPIEAYAREFGRALTPAELVQELTDALTRAVDELTRPIDAIKHQAKTVTVGISRSDEEWLARPLVQAVLAAGAAREAIGWRDLRALAALDDAVAEVSGFTRYRIDGEEPARTIAVVGRGGIGAKLRSRTEAQPALRGTKHLVASEQRLLVATGRSDQRTFVLVPELTAGRTTGLTLLHIRCHDRLPAPVLRTVLESYRDRYRALVDSVLETEPAFDDSRLAAIPVVDVLTSPIAALADQWR